MKVTGYCPWRWFEELFLHGPPVTEVSIFAKPQSGIKSTQGIKQCFWYEHVISREKAAGIVAGMIVFDKEINKQLRYLRIGILFKSIDSASSKQWLTLVIAYLIKLHQPVGMRDAIIVNENQIIFREIVD